MTTETVPPPCERTQDNHRYAEEARRVLADDHAALGWIFPPGKHERVGVLVELGQIARVRGEEACRTMARAVCTEPHASTTREAAANLRRYRLGLPEPAPPETCEDFEIALNIALAEALQQEPDVRLDVLEATVAKFAAELGELVEVLRDAG